MKSLLRLLLLGCLAGALDARSADGLTVLTTEHTDLLIVHDAGATPPLRMKVRAESELEATNVLLTIAEAAKLSVPSNPNFAFLGQPGDPVWILPASQEPDLLYLGVSSDLQIPPFGEFTASSTARVVRVSAPGKFFVWQTVSGAPPNVFVNAAPGESGPTNRVVVFNPSHAHFNFGFSTSGVYRVTFRPEAELATGGLITGTNETFVFHVAPLNDFERWQTNHWSPTAPEEIVAPEADPDLDGVANYAEYVLGSDPNDPDRSLFPQALVVSVEGQPFGAVRYRRLKTATEVVVEIYARTSVSDGEETLLTEVVATNDLGDYEEVTVRDNQPLGLAAQRVYRVVARRN